MTLIENMLSINGVAFLMFCIFAIAALGYGLGRITVKGVNLGTAGVFIVALLFGCFFFEPLKAQLMVTAESGDAVSYVDNALKVVESLGLILFVTSVGFIAGPKFFGNMKKNFKSYVLLGLVIILSGGLAAVACIFIGKGIGFGASIETQLYIVLALGVIFTFGFYNFSKRQIEKNGKFLRFLQSIGKCMNFEKKGIWSIIQKSIDKL